MSENNPMFRINKLMGYADIDAFAAQKNIGSKAAYFELLNRFVVSAPGLAQRLELLVNEGNWQEFRSFVDTLQDQLMKIGATTMMWEAEKLVVLAREQQYRKCAAESTLFATKLRGLHEKICEARIEPAAEPEKKTPEAAPALIEEEKSPEPAAPIAQPDAEQEQKGKRQTVLKAESLERIQMLVENFELDHALTMLQGLLAYSYGKELDPILNRAYSKLATFDYESAQRNLHMAYIMAQSVEADGQKNVKKKILAIDDVPDVLSTVKAVLGDRYSVYGVTNHKAALKFLTANHADLVLLDIEMPDMNGFAMLGIIRKLRAYEKTPVVFLTSNANAENVKMSHALGANDFIKKPIEAAILNSKIEKHLPLK